MSRKPFTVNSRRAPLLPSTHAASSPLNRVFTGTSTPPAAWMPSAASTHAALFGAQIAARSPGWRPAAMAARAERYIAAGSSA